ncbi:hypothetical protein LSH36_785g01048 [Paralvinella palmiformis]|uniref:TBC1 domain family member 7 n=1 Tax=Paralvinella palmiformis TaxID=53620 RepID=A0AAD9MSS8_9ANNE|nr:hypothetical protein LSH36_785g01048 [Paralvinella palmiformis]
MHTDCGTPCILPSHLEVCDFVKRQRQEQYEDLKQTLITIHRINEWTPLPHLQLRMFLIEQGRLPLKENNMVEQLECYLKKEDSQLYSHLRNTCSLCSVPTRQWFMSCFAGTLPESAFERICDRVIAGTYQLLVFVGISVLIALRHRLLSKNNTEDIIKYLEKLPEESGDVIIMKALEIWQKHGCPLAPATCRSESPIPGSDRGHT